jgi:SAM-dependent methyltransferase
MAHDDVARFETAGASIGGRLPPSTTETSGSVFVRDDGRRIPVVEGFGKRVRYAPRLSVQPKATWTDDDYKAAADAKVSVSAGMVAKIAQWGVKLEGARALEVGCGPGIDCLLLGVRPVREVVGIDLALPLFEENEYGERVRRLTRMVLATVGLEGGIEGAVATLPVLFARMDATRLEFPDHSFDFVYSRAVMEHIRPPEAALAEMARVLRPGGVMYHRIDPFYWLKGCHKRGLVDIPWAHARLTAAEYRRFVAEHEGEAKAEKRLRHLATLNQLTLEQWRRVIEEGPFEILDWSEDVSDFAESLLSAHPDVEETLLPNVRPRDLVRRRIQVWLRANAAA